MKTLSDWPMPIGNLFFPTARTNFLSSIVLIFPHPWSWILTHGAWRGIGLLNSEWHRTIEEGVVFQTGNQLWLLFVCILLNCHPADPQTSANDRQLHLSDDWSHLLIREILPMTGSSLLPWVWSAIYFRKTLSDLDHHHLAPPAHEFEPVCTLANQIVDIGDGTTTINDTNHDHTIHWHTKSILANNSVIQSFADVVTGFNFSQVFTTQIRLLHHQHGWQITSSLLHVMIQWQHSIKPSSIRSWSMSTRQFQSADTII